MEQQHHTDDAGAAHQALADWLGGDDPEPVDLDPPSRPRPRIRSVAVITAVALWLLVAAVAIGRSSDAPADPRGEVLPVPPSLRQQASPAGSAALLALHAGVLDGGLVVRHAVVERVDALGDVSLVVLRAAVGGPGGASVARFAVPVRGGRTLSAPWALPPGDDPEPRWDPVSDAELAQAAVHALEAHGYRSVRQLAISRSAELPGVLRVRAKGQAPNSDRDAEHVAWLHDVAPYPMVGAAHEAGRP